MENIVTAVEGAIGAVETEAKKVEAAVEGCVEHVYAYVCKRCHQLKSDAADTVTQAQHDAEEDARAIEGSFKRFMRRVWAWL